MLKRLLALFSTKPTNKVVKAELPQGLEQLEVMPATHWWA